VGIILENKMETRNAIIKKTFLGIEDHGIFTATLTLNYGGTEQGFGMHDLTYEAYGIKYLRSILKAVGVESWEDLVGTPIRAKCEFTKVHAIGHLIEDKWFEPEA
jgi:hypothetical protein